MKRILPLLFFPLVLLSFSCQEDTDRVIHTDITVEATQLLQTSSNWGESLFFAMLDFEDYRQMESEYLPGCPEIQISDGDRRVTIDFSNKKGCDGEDKTFRSGKIILDFSQQSGFLSFWTMRYENYSFKNFKISGERRFSFVNLTQIKETFENLTFESEKEVRTVISGEFNHSTILSGGLLTGIRTSGSLEGTNPVGRSISMILQAPREEKVECFLTDEPGLPNSAIEIWEISRTSPQTISHSLFYSSTNPCLVQVEALLSDGRRLQLQ
ncbi:MAG: hypothetical protein HWE15_02450 [Algoriphagus sp.]|uniref:hypothetical protein n=1 Tax=Algoriphagus sp. TaxID=1872435 RepID=UPI001802BD0A|nr:hypothetical protein [Algoriphagus sp.]NVJ85133.1 hypothetical protein [Algoriphagus sp.]